MPFTESSISSHRGFTGLGEDAIGRAETDGPLAMP
jgi:hypothetical protein